MLTANLEKKDRTMRTMTYIPVICAALLIIAREVSLMVYDLLGREVVRLVDGTMEPGYHEVLWNGQGFASGIYIARLVTPMYSKSIKMLLLK